MIASRHVDCQLETNVDDRLLRSTCVVSRTGALACKNVFLNKIAQLIASVPVVTKWDTVFDGDIFRFP